MILPIYTIADLEAEHERLHSLPATDPENPFGFERDDHNGGFDIYWGRYSYWVSDDQFKTPMALLGVLHHLGQKGWPDATTGRMAQFIDSVFQINGWSLYSDNTAPAARTTSATQERAKLTPTLRYNVLVRDDFRCRACGASPETGAHLHIDHITPIAKGGTTNAENLQALCSSCNFGKGSQ